MELGGDLRLRRVRRRLGGHALQALAVKGGRSTTHRPLKSCDQPDKSP
jgi:hypothetical protein